MWLSKSELIRKMQMIGYYYDEINSYDEWIVFNFIGGHIDFDNWNEVYDWYMEVSD